MDVDSILLVNAWSMIVSDLQAAPQAWDCEGAYLTCAQVQLQKTMAVWFNRGLDIGRGIFVTCAVFELVVSGFSAIRKRGDLGDIAQMAIIKVLALTMVWLLIEASAVWLGGDGLLDWSTRVGPESAAQVAEIDRDQITPGFIVITGWNVFVNGLQSLPAGRFFFMNPLDLILCLLTAVASILLLVTYIRIAIELLKTMAECYLAAGGGVILLGFLSFRGTAPLGEGLIRYLVQATVKLFFLTLVAFACAEMALGLQEILEAGRFGAFGPNTNVITQGLNALDSIPQLFGTLLGVLLTTMLAHSLLSIPDKLAQSITQSLTVNIKAFLQQL